MHGENQANRLASLIKKHHSVPTYELALPLVLVKSSRLDALKKDDILLLKQKHLEYILLNNDTILAKATPMVVAHRYIIRITALVQSKLAKSQKHTHEVLKLSCGELCSRIIEVGHTIELAGIEMQSVTLVRKGKEIAKASLHNVHGEIAVQIDKVIQ